MRVEDGASASPNEIWSSEQTMLLMSVHLIVKRRE